MRPEDAAPAEQPLPRSCEDAKWAAGDILEGRRQPRVVGGAGEIFRGGRGTCGTCFRAAAVRGSRTFDTGQRCYRGVLAGESVELAREMDMGSAAEAGVEGGSDQSDETVRENRRAGGSGGLADVGERVPRNRSLGEDVDDVGSSNRHCLKVLGGCRQRCAGTDVGFGWSRLCVFLAAPRHSTGSGSRAVRCQSARWYTNKPGNDGPQNLVPVPNDRYLTTWMFDIWYGTSTRYRVPGRRCNLNAYKDYC